MWPKRRTSEAAQDFVAYDNRGGVSVDLGKYLKTAAGQEQLKSLGEWRTDEDGLSQSETEKEA